MDNRDDELPRGAERRQFDAYEGTVDEHGQPREYHYGSSFDKPHRGREPEDVFTQPYDQWSSPRYVFYGGEGYHREFVDPYARGFDPEGGEGGGRIIATGTPEDVAEHDSSATGRFLAALLSKPTRGRTRPLAG